MYDNEPSVLLLKTTFCRVDDRAVWLLIRVVFCRGNAELFDKEENDKIHPNVDMPVYGYCTSTGIESLAVDLSGELLFHRRISDGHEGNGFLETHVFVISSSSKQV